MTILQLKNITMNFQGLKKPALRALNYTVQSGDFIILLGSNGSGKTTLLKLLHRHHHAHSGEIHFLGKPLSQHSTKKFSEQVAVLTQNFSDSLFHSLTIYENYLLMKKKIHTTDRKFLIDYLNSFNLNLAKKLDVIVDHLSGGEKQALALAFCLLQPPSLLLLDEHTSALDPNIADHIMQLTKKMIEKHRITCILTTHDLEIALRYGNRILVLREGEIHKSIDAKDKCKLSKEDLVKMYY